jgi:hypothetical protein
MIKEEEKIEQSTISRLNLKTIDVFKVVYEWYINRSIYFVNENEEDVESYLDFKHNISVTRKLKLSEEDVLNVVLEWYTNGLCTDVFQDEDGVDLEEYIESKLNQ